MPIIEVRLSPTFKRFLLSEQASGLLLLVCTVASLILANSPLGDAYLHFWHIEIASLTLEAWVNDGLMAIFFLLIGLELKRELYVGELSNIRYALLPIVAALGGLSCRRQSTSHSTTVRHPVGNGHSHGDRHRFCPRSVGAFGESRSSFAQGLSCSACSSRRLRCNCRHCPVLFQGAGLALPWGNISDLSGVVHLQPVAC